MAVVFRKVVERLQLKGYKIEVLWIPSHIGNTGNKRADEVAEQAARRAKHTYKGPKQRLVSHIRRSVNTLKKRERQHILRASNMGEEYVFSGNKSIKTFKKSETSRLIQYRINHFVSDSYEKRRDNQMENNCTFCRKDAIIRDHLMIRYIILRNKNLDLIKECKLYKSKITGYGLAEKRRREDPFFWKLR